MNQNVHSVLVISADDSLKYVLIPKHSILTLTIYQRILLAFSYAVRQRRDATNLRTYQTRESILQS
jgi:hypothetical protein